VDSHYSCSDSDTTTEDSDSDLELEPFTLEDDQLCVYVGDEASTYGRGHRV